MKLIVFDWDGTLADSTTNIVLALQRSCADLALEIPTAAQAKYVIGLGLRDTLMTVAPKLTEDRYPEMVAAFRKHFLESEHDIGLFDGAREMVDDLNGRGALLAIATGKSRVGLARALERLDWAKSFVTTRCADQGQPKPHPEMLLHVVNTCGADLAKTVMVGDTTHDMLLAQNAGVRAFACGYGAHDSEPLAAHNPIALAASVQELHQHLIKWLDHD